MSQDPTAAYINYLFTENCYVEAKCDRLMSMVHMLESNISCLNTFIQSTYDMSMNMGNCVHITTYDSMGNILSCANYDASGNFTLCDTDMSGNFLPSVLPPGSRGMALPNSNIQTGMTRPHPQKQRGYPYYPPYYTPYYHSYYDPYYSYDPHCLY